VGYQEIFIPPAVFRFSIRPCVSAKFGNNPLVPLPASPQEFLTKIDAVVVTPTRGDHWDSTAEKLLPKTVPLFGQPEDETKFQAAGFTASRLSREDLQFQIEAARLSDRLRIPADGECGMPGFSR
jgi:hypothetical protein